MIRAIIIVTILLWPMGNLENLFAQNSFEPWSNTSLNQSSWGTGRKVLDYQFDRADRQLNPGKWMEEARRGIMTARLILAEMSPELFLDPRENERFSEWTERELENRFTRWLLERFFGTGIEISVAGVFHETGEADKYFIYLTGADGNILYDPTTGDPRVIRPGEEGHDFAADTLSWREMTHNAADRETRSYRIGILEMYPELLRYIPAGQEEEFQRKLAATGEQAVMSLKHEFEAILSREERYFTAQRLGDVWSLRKKSENMSAAAIGAMLIEEARQACADGMAAIEQRIEAAKADGVDLTLAGNQWLEEYREQFNRGLQAWESAEERFLLRRLEWEHSAEKVFYEGMEIWRAVFIRFEEERVKWENEARLLFLEGEQFFAQASQDLEKAIAAAKSEFERDARLRIGVVAGRTDALASIYLLSSSAAEEAQKNVDFWTDRYRELKPLSAIPSGNENIDTWASDELLLLTNKPNSLEKIILEELKHWLALRRDYTLKTQENLEALARELYSIADINDPYETELLRAKGELEYWKNRVTMAEAVMTYAEAIDAGRMTAAESIAAWERAKAAYDEALDLYGEVDAAVKKGGNELSATRDAFVQAAEKMRSADIIIENLRKSYQSLISAMGKAGNDITVENLVVLYERLKVEQAVLERSDKDSPWGNFLNIACILEEQLLKETRKMLLEQLIEGDEEEFESMADLVQRMESGSPPEDDPLSRLAEKLYLEGKVNYAQYNLFLSVLFDRYKSRAKIELETRLSAISLLSNNNSSMEWYSSVRDKEKTESHDSATSSVEALLFYDWERDSLEFLRARAKLELETLDLIEGKGTSDAAGIFALLYSGDETQLKSDREYLEQILELLNADVSDKPVEITDERILFFMSGGSFIDPQHGLEIARAVLIDYARKEEYSEGLYNIYMGFSHIAQAAIQENVEQGFKQFGRLWETLGIETGNSIFPSTMTIINTLTELDGNAYSGILSLILVLDEIFYSLPQWLELPFTLWKESLIGFYASPSETTLRTAERQTDLLNATLLLLLNDENSFALSYDDDDYEAAFEELIGYYSRERYIIEEIDRLSAILGFLNKDSETAMLEMKNVSDQIAMAEKSYKEFEEAFQKAANDLQHSGTVYDTLYGEAEHAFKNLEAARKAFETQDAIRLWAGSVYLDASRPAEELAYSKERASRALNALELLESLSEDREAFKTGDYKKSYELYQESLSIFALSLDALRKHEQVIMSELEKNNLTYQVYQYYLSLLGNSSFMEKEHATDEIAATWQALRFMVTIDSNGFLVFAMNSDNKLSGSDEEKLKTLNEYFGQNRIVDNEINMVSSFELAMRELNAFFLNNNLDREKYRQLGLARDYLILELIRNNPDIPEAANWYNTATSLGKDHNLGNMAVLVPNGSDRKVHDVANSISTSVANAQKGAWDSLDENTKKALEFYTILTLLDGGGSELKFFSRITEYLEFESVFQIVNRHWRTYRKKADRFIIGAVHKNKEKIMWKTKNQLAVPRNYLNTNINKAHFELTETLSNLGKTLAAYKESSDRIAILLGIKNTAIQWEDIEKALGFTNNFNGDLSSLKELWERANNNMNHSVNDIQGALRLLVDASKNTMEEQYRNLNALWQTGKNERAESEIAYRDLYNVYVSGYGDLNDLRASAVLSFNGGIPDTKAHLESIGNILIQSLCEFEKLGLAGTPESSLLAKKYTEIINRAWEEKYSSELITRVNEWSFQQSDIQEKLSRWRDSADIIIEQGRIAWKESEDRLHEAHDMWVKTFEEEYVRISNGWTAAYLEGLKDKEAWAATAFETAGQASSAATIALIGRSAEAGSRAMDTRDPLGFMNIPDTREGEKILLELLERSGVDSLSSAFSSIRDSGRTLATVVRSGISGGGIWNSTSVTAKAASMARTVREEFETRESRKMAFMVMNTANDLYIALKKNIRDANEQNRKRFNETFIMGGQWIKSGTSYVKSVVVHSTLTNAVITDRAKVEGYRDFTPSAIKLSSDMSEVSLRNLNAFEVETYIDSLYSEIDELFERFFASNTGEFNIYTGVAPEIKQRPNINKGRSGVFNHFGSGESGRLLTEFYFWMLKEQNGIAAMAAAPWDKPIWDSRDSAFDAPTIRSSVNTLVSTAIIIAGAVAALPTGGSSIVGSIALTVAMNSASDFAFTTMDIAGGYKSWEEAGLGFGKTLLTNTVTATAGALFNGVAGVSSSFFNSGGVSGLVSDRGIGGAAYKTLTSGINTLSTGTINSAVASVTYDRKNGFGFSDKNFARSFSGNSIGAISGIAGTFTSGLMNWGITGFLEDIHANAGKLSNLAGGLVSQGVNYTLGNDFTLNLLNAGIFFDKKHNINAGLFETRIGRNGTSFAFGSGGMDASIGTLVSAAKGIEAWKVNAELLLSKNQNSRTYASAMRTLYSRGNEERIEYENLLAGRTIVEERRGIAETKSEYDWVTGKKTIFLGSDALNSGNAFTLNVIFSHEAHRDGIYNGIIGQNIERDNAVTAHIATVNALRATYGADAVIAGMVMEADLFNFAQATNNTEMINAILGRYDSSADYWKLLRDGTLLNDNSGWLTDELGRPILNAEGKQIGAAGIETGLLNILFGGTSNTAYSTYTDEQVKIAQDIMISAGMNPNEGEDGTQRSRTWTGNNSGISLNMDKVMIHTGNTIASQVFARHFDATTYNILALLLQKNIGRVAGKLVPASSMERYVSLVQAKRDFYESAGSIVDLAYEYYISLGFGEKFNEHYAFYLFKHFGFDLSRLGSPENDPIFAGISGIMSRSNWNPANGNSIEIEYGYRFEDSFIGSGLYGQYLHMVNAPPFSKGAHIGAATKIGEIGGTPNFAPHLHYSILAKNDNFSQATLTMLLGKNASASSFLSAKDINGNQNRVFDPVLYYSNFLGTTLLTKNDFLASKR